MALFVDTANKYLVADDFKPAQKKKKKIKKRKKKKKNPKSFYVAFRSIFHGREGKGGWCRESWKSLFQIRRSFRRYRMFFHADTSLRKRAISLPGSPPIHMQSHSSF